MFSVFGDINCNNRGQTSRSVAEVQIQTSCNFKASKSYYDSFLGCDPCLYNNVLLELRSDLMVQLYSYISLSSHLNFLLC